MSPSPPRLTHPLWWSGIFWRVPILLLTSPFSKITLLSGDFFLTTKENLENVETPEEDKINNPQSHHSDIITPGADSLLAFFFFFFCL